MVNRYPDRYSSDLEEIIASHHGLQQNNICVGAGARIGYSITSSGFTSQVSSSQMFGMVSNLGQAAALAALTDAENIASQLDTLGYQVRTGWGMPNYIRISIGLMAEMHGFMNALDEIFGLLGSVHHQSDSGRICGQ